MHSLGHLMTSEGEKQFVLKRYVSENMRIRMIDEGRAIEVEQGKGKKKVKAIFKTPDSTLDD